MWDDRKAAVISRLLAPYTVRQFHAMYYERAPLHIKRNDAGYYARYFSLRELERVLYGVEMPARDLRLSKDGSDIRRAQFSRKVQRVDDATGELQWTYLVDPYRVSALFAQGCTIVSDDLRPYSAHVARLLRSLEMFFKHKVFAGMFLTPPHSQGFAQHYDIVDSFILQVEGSKHWTVRAPAIDLPLEQQKHDKKLHKPGEILFDGVLCAGDFLYLPRGTFHEARAGDHDYSLHLALGLAPIRWNAVVERILTDAAQEHAALRRSTAAPLDRELLVDIVTSALSEKNLNRAVAAMESQFAGRHRGALDGQLRQILAADELSDESIVSLRDDTLYDMAVTENSVILKSFDNEMVLPPAAASIIHALEATTFLRARDLAEHAGALSILTRLIRAGLVIQHDSAVPAISRLAVTPLPL